MASSPTALSLYPEVAFPDDPGLEDLPKLFDSDWIWRAYCCQFGRPGMDPCRIRVRQFAHSLGRVALVSYEMEWRPDEQPWLDRQNNSAHNAGSRHQTAQGSDNHARKRD